MKITLDRITQFGYSDRINSESGDKLMCDNHNDFLDDDLTDVFGPGLTDDAANFVMDHLSKATHEKPKGQALYEEPCTKCNGTGRFRSYTGRVVGDCFTCNGTGKRTFKTSPEARAKNAKAREAARQRKLEEQQAKQKRWIDDHVPEWEWMVAKCTTFGFAQSMIEALAQWGALTEKQLAAVRRCMAQDLEREREKAEIAERAPDIDEKALAKIEQAFAHALERDVKYPKMRLDAFIFSLVRGGRNAGAIYVKSDEKDEYGEREYLGKIVEGRFFRAFKCSPETEARIIAAAADPEAAAIAYGRRVGNCSICGRGLTKHESIDRGIGPICASKFGWG